MKKILLISMAASIFSVAFVCSAEESKPIDFSPVEIQEECYSLFSLMVFPATERASGTSFLEENLVIDDQGSYDHFQRALVRTRSVDCSNVEFPKINFSERTLLGNWTSGSCATRELEKSVLRNDQEKLIIYFVKIRNAENVSCTGLGRHSFNLISIPKVPKGFRVIFHPYLNDRNRYRQCTSEGGRTLPSDWGARMFLINKMPPPSGGVFGVEFR